MKKSRSESQPTDIEALFDDYLVQVKLIRESRYMTYNKEANIKIRWNSGAGLTIDSPQMPDREVIEAFLLRMRPVIVKKERLYMGKILNALIESAYADSEKGDLIKLQANIENHRNRRLFAIKVDDKEYGMPDFVWLYLYGKYFHIDEEKKDLIKQFEDVLGPLPEVSALSQIEAYAGFALVIGGIIIRKRKMQQLNTQ